MSWTKQEADKWLAFYTEARQNGWKHHKDGTWSHFARGTTHFLSPEVRRILEIDKERNANKRRT